MSAKSKDLVYRIENKIIRRKDKYESEQIMSAEINLRY
jgi:hypothetical protein